MARFLRRPRNHQYASTPAIAATTTGITTAIAAVAPTESPGEGMGATVAVEEDVEVVIVEELEDDDVVVVGRSLLCQFS